MESPTKSVPTWSLSCSPGAPLLLPVLGKGISDCFFVILLLNPACPVLASRRILLVKAVVLPCDDLDLVLLAPEDPDASDPDLVILRLKSPTERRRRRWNARSEEALLSRAIVEAKSKSGEEDLPTRGKGMRDWRLERGERTTSEWTVIVGILLEKE